VIDTMQGCMEATKYVKSRKSKKALGVLRKGILTPSFIEIALVVTKHPLLTDNDERHVIAIPEVN
jgi:hypothetical protein